MGAGQIGGISSLLDIDFRNAAGFHGSKAMESEGQYIVHYLSHVMMFCLGTLIEAHVVLTPAICVFGERYQFSVFAGTHRFVRYAGIERVAKHVCTHKGFNHSKRWTQCATSNLALLVLEKQFSFHEKEIGADFPVNRIRYGVKLKDLEPVANENKRCKYFGWGSRRNGYLIPLLVDLHKVDALILPVDQCYPMWNYEEQFLCIQQIPCKSEKYGALCPDDVGSVIECSGFLMGMMISRLVDRPCGVGFLDLTKYFKFLTCGVDDAREVIDHDDTIDIEPNSAPHTPILITVPTTPNEEDEPTVTFEK